MPPSSNLLTCTIDFEQLTSSHKSYLDKDWAEEAPDAGPLGRTWYLPHHAVYQMGSTGKVKCRVVFDGSARFRDIALNDLLDSGAKHQADLLGILIRFRRYRIDLQAHIQKMYMQVALHEADRDVCSLTCSPYLAMQMIRLQTEKHQPNTLRHIATSFQISSQMRREWLEKRPDSWAREDSTSPRAQRQSSALEDTGEPLAEGSRRADLPTTGNGGGRGPGHEERRADCSGLSLRSVGLPGAIHVPPRNLITLKRRLQFFTEELEQLCADNAATGMMEAQLVVTEEMYRRVDLLQEEYEAGLDGEEVKTAMAEWAEYRKGFRGITVRARTLLSAGKVEAAGSQNTKAIEVRGDVTEFRGFWDRFADSIHKRTDLSDGAKLTYLRGCLTCDALRSIISLSSSNADYEVAVQRLKERFDRPYTADDTEIEEAEAEERVEGSLDERGILTVEGRLRRVNLLVETKHPMLLPHGDERR
ncbi:hypothetical protein T01_2299 [Trichinella spiralis]|uniref:Uncharacterized protein n=1 Tax=Trichinella spiralis TaxID=6334 RepID=A0A0V1B7N9_TRISP|nr:hypothetical protein T01_2299 [Trichinella spiralis]